MRNNHIKNVHFENSIKKDKYLTHHRSQGPCKEEVHVWKTRSSSSHLPTFGESPQAWPFSETHLRSEQPRQESDKRFFWGQKPSSNPSSVPSLTNWQLGTKQRTRLTNFRVSASCFEVPNHCYYGFITKREGEGDRDSFIYIRKIVIRDRKIQDRIRVVA